MGMSGSKPQSPEIVVPCQLAPSLSLFFCFAPSPLRKADGFDAALNTSLSEVTQRPSGSDITKGLFAWLSRNRTNREQNQSESQNKAHLFWRM